LEANVKSRIAVLALIAGTLIAAAVPAASGATTQPAWPRTFTSGGTKVVVYQPQVTQWPNYTVLSAMAALAVTQAGAKGPTYGTATFSGYTAADFQTGIVTLTDPRITGTHWPGLGASQAASLDALARGAIQLKNSTVPLATVLASLDASKALPKPVAVRNDPPQIFTTTGKGILVVFDGNPIMAPIQGTSLTFAVNTNWAVISDGARYYLLDAGHWLSAASVQGPWQAATAPASFAAIPDDPNWTDVRQALTASAVAAADVPQVFVSTQPADLIAVEGAPQLVAIAGTHLQYADNTPNDLFFYKPATQWYVLLSGRWFRASTLNGPWTFASTTLPADFAKIPLNSPRGSVLVSVPGTAAAQYAGASTEVPQVATVNPQNAKLTVTYTGDPQFKPIEGTSLQYAVNTQNDVVKIDDTTYYACYSGVWFAASSPQGPWTVAGAVPPVIYTIPPSSPLYADTFVYVYNADGAQATPPPQATPGPYAATTEVLAGYTLGYLNSYWANGGWVYGTGWYWPGYYYPGVIPIYYPYAWTWNGGWGWGWGGAYAGWGGAYGRWGGYYGPYGGAAYRAQYNPATGTYARGGAVYGPNGAVGGGAFYNPRYGVAGRTVQGSNPYGSWGRSAVTTRYGNAVTGHVNTANGSAAGIATRNGTTAVAQAKNGDVYAGHDGNVYRNQNGTWQKSTGGGSWSDVHPPSPSADRASPSTDRAATSGYGYHPSATPAYRPSSTNMINTSDLNGLNRDYTARQSGFSGFHGFGGGGGRSFGGFRGR